MKPVTPSGKLQGSCRCWIEPVITRHLVVAKIAPIPEIASRKEKAGMAGKLTGQTMLLAISNMS
jgi:hypothetical protein